MAEGIEVRRRGPLEGLGSVSVAPLPPGARLTVRGGSEAAARVGRAFGCDLPAEALRAAAAGERAALWLGPDEWLLIAPGGENLSALEAALAGEPGCVVDVSHRQAAFAVSGEGAEAALNAGCPLDLDERSFPVGQCTRTVLAKADMVLWRTAADAFHVECWRSFAPYVHGFLTQAALDVSEA